MTATENTVALKNKVLTAIRPDALEFLRGRMDTRQLHPGDLIYQQGQPFTHAIFPHEGVVSLMAQMADGRTVEKASIGYEGFLGFALILGGGGALSHSVVRVGGTASWIGMADLDEAIVRFPCVNTAMLSYAKLLIMQLLESVACNSLHTSSQRIARWLLEADDRVHHRPFDIKQEEIAGCLALRRATASEVCSQFQKDELITYSRGRLAICDRPGLEARACQCYGTVRAAFRTAYIPPERLLGLPERAPEEDERAP